MIGDWPTGKGQKWLGGGGVKCRDTIDSSADYLLIIITLTMCIMCFRNLHRQIVIFFYKALITDTCGQRPVFVIEEHYEHFSCTHKSTSNVIIIM